MVSACRWKPLQKRWNSQRKQGIYAWRSYQNLPTFRMTLQTIEVKSAKWVAWWMCETDWVNRYFLQGKTCIRKEAHSVICLSLDSVFVFLFSQTFIKHTLASAAQCDGASVGGMEARYLGYRIKFGWGGVGGGLPLVAFLQMSCMPHKTFSSTEYILGCDSMQ